MNVAFVLLIAAAIGSMSGLRAFTPLAFVSWLGVWGWLPSAGSPFAFLGTTICAVIVSILALVELIGDKLPKTPARTAAAPLGARIITGAMSGASICFAGGRHWILGIVAGAIGSIAGAFGGYHLRRFLVQHLRIPDFVVALIEDFVTIAGTLILLKYFFGKPV
ncbi:MAG: DUF4126 family protein [Verrucomicrobiota bacterium]